ncbi:hypothetical protein E4631_23925 [Hymenobacter sp. UV11]|uniref:hypothetical protein n=1 Tax=Hymenobacter sp. UV11 TaxID=1849735 RepID=UPI00105B7EE5|nr:hypothetical protein [Hymenobacter sp. UV11]TFZ62979.1 hypothetical protein E4631_23925 [Hymenobacter sp. UV11]
METERKIKMGIREVRDTLETAEYDSVIESLLRKVYSRNMTISFYENRKDSVCETSTDEIDGSITCVLRIKKKPAFGNVKEILFDIMHEMGHGLDENRLELKDKCNLEVRYARELRAWKIADKEFATHPELKADKLEYNRYKHECLKDYEQLLLKRKSPNT